jgi:hypothetical protein
MLVSLPSRWTTARSILALLLIPPTLSIPPTLIPPKMKAICAVAQAMAATVTSTTTITTTITTSITVDLTPTLALGPAAVVTSITRSTTTTAARINSFPVVRMLARIRAFFLMDSQLFKL